MIRFFLLLALTLVFAPANAQQPVNPMLSASNPWNGQNWQPWCALTFANPLVSNAVKCANNSNASPHMNSVTLTGNTVLQMPVGLKSGQVMVYRITQDGTGSRTLTLPTNGTVTVPSSYLSGGNVTLTGTASSTDQITCVGFGGTAPTWLATEMDCGGLAFNFSSACPQAGTFLARTSGENAAAVTTLICGLVADGMIDTTASMASTGTNTYCGSGSVFDILQIHAMANSTDALLDVCGHTSAVAHGSPVFTANAGFTGVDASNTVYIDTGYNMSTATLASLNNAHFSIWSLTAGHQSASGIFGATDSTANQTRFYPLYTDGNFYGEINDSSVMVFAGHSDGWLLFQRTASNARAYIRNGSTVNSDSTASSAIPNSNLYDLNASQTNAPTSSGDSLLNAIFTAGPSLSGGQLTNAYSLFCSYLTTVHGSC